MYKRHIGTHKRTRRSTFTHIVWQGCEVCQTKPTETDIRLYGTIFTVSILPLDIINLNHERGNSSVVVDAKNMNSVNKDIVPGVLIMPLNWIRTEQTPLYYL